MLPRPRIPALLLVLTYIAHGGCGGGGPTKPGGKGGGQETIPLDGRGGGVLTYTLQPGSPGGVHEIHIMNADGSGDRRLVEASVGLNHHDWSPDGAHVAAVGYYGETWSVHTFDRDGSNLTRLTNTSGVWDSDPNWSPDGALIAFTRTYPDQGRSEIWLMQADGTDQRYIGVEGLAARWSRDGTRLVYLAAVGAGGPVDIMTCRRDGTDIQNLTDTPETETAPTWSPDGSKLAFAADYEGSYDIYVMDADGSNLLLLTDTNAGDFSPRWSPDGSLIAFDSDEAGTDHWEVYVVGSDGHGLRRVTNTPAPNTATNPTWRP